MIKQQTAFSTWVTALRYIIDHGQRYKDIRKRNCIEVPNLVLSVVDPLKQLTIPIEHLQNIGPWSYPTIQEIAEIVLTREKNSIYEYVYGTRIFKYAGNINQVNDYVIPLLKKDPQSRRAIISFTDPKEDMSLQANHFPGLICIDFKIREDKLYATAFIRSSDVFIGWPANIYQIYILQDYIAARLDVQVGGITTIATSAHIFEEHLKYINRIIK